MKVYALHGFLGKPTDWNLHSYENVELIDLFSGPITPFTEWAESFNRYVSQDFEHERLLIGYSMGGRLALHALIDNPLLWSRAILISCHAGLQSKSEREERFAKDTGWANRFLKDPWDPLMVDWNRQAVFRGQTALYRDEIDFDRQSLSRALTTWSLGKQEDLVPCLKDLITPITWIAGELDKKYGQLTHFYARQSPTFAGYVIPGTGHRIYDLPTTMTQFLPTLSP